MSLPAVKAPIMAPSGTMDVTIELKVFLLSTTLTLLCLYWLNIITVNELKYVIPNPNWNEHRVMTIIQDNKKHRFMLLAMFLYFKYNLTLTKSMHYIY